MNKFIAYTIVDNDVDGRGPSRIVAAYMFEEKRDEAFEANKNKNYLSKGEVIVDKEKRKAEALAKLDGIDRLVLGLDKDFPNRNEPFPVLKRCNEELRSRIPDSHSSNCTNGFRD